MKRHSVLPLASLVAFQVWAQDPNQTFELRPGVIIEPGNNLVYVMAPDKAIDAIDLKTGKRLWRTQSAAKPLSVVGSMLIGQQEPTEGESILRIAVVDAHEGKKQIFNATVQLPQNVRVLIDETSDKSFRITADATGPAVPIYWEYVERPIRGVPPDTEDDRNIAEVEEEDKRGPTTPSAVTESRIVSGSIRLDPRSRSVTSLPPDDKHIELLRQFAETAPSAKIKAAPGAPTFQSKDGRHVMRSERVADDRVWDKYRWTIYDAQNLKEVGAASVVSHK